MAWMARMAGGIIAFIRNIRVICGQNIFRFVVAAIPQGRAMLFRGLFLAFSMLVAAGAAPTSREPANLDALKQQIQVYVDSGSYREDITAVAAEATAFAADAPAPPEEEEKEDDEAAAAAEEVALALAAAASAAACACENRSPRASRSESSPAVLPRVAAWCSRRRSRKGRQ